jgi:hypothetical protein
MKTTSVFLLFAFLLAGEKIPAQNRFDEIGWRNREQTTSPIDGDLKETAKPRKSGDSAREVIFSGYLQVNFEKTERENGFSKAENPYDKDDRIKSRFLLRRSRLKAEYDAGLTRLEIMADFSNSEVSLRSAYLDVTEPWLELFSLRAGVFSRPDFEVEYSSSVRESPERSAVIRALYPGERDLGAMLTFSREDLFTLQFAAFNNTYRGTFEQQDPNFGEEPLYFMGRVTRSLALGHIALDIGMHGRFGMMRLNTDEVYESEMPVDGQTKPSIYEVGSRLARSWFGIEAQIHYDFHGGMKLFGEYIVGKDVNEPDDNPPYSAARKRDFTGFYIMFVRNLGSDFQIAAKYDSFTPNSSIDYERINTSKELTASTFGFGAHNYTFPNVRLTVWYDIVTTKTNGYRDSGGARPFASDPKDNLLTLRAQYKF